MRANEIDITGKRFGRLVCIGTSEKKYITPEGEVRAKWDFQCDCGKITAASKSSVLSGRTKSCGCLRSEGAKISAEKNTRRTFEKWERYKGKKFGRLTIQKYSHVTEKHMYMYVMRCDCGIVKAMSISRVVSGCYKSCGCLSGVKRTSANKEQIKEMERIAGFIAHPLRSLFEAAPAIRTTKATYTHKMD